MVPDLEGAIPMPPRGPVTLVVRRNYISRQ